MGGLFCISMYFFCPVVGEPGLCPHQERLVEDIEDRAVDTSSARFSLFDYQASILCSVPRMVRLFFSFLHFTHSHTSGSDEAESRFSVTLSTCSVFPSSIKTDYGLRASEAGRQAGSKQAPKL